MAKRFLLGLALLGWAMPASAIQDSTGPGVPGDDPTAGGKPVALATEDAAASDDKNRPKFWFQIDVAPEIASQDPFSSDSTTSDSTDVRWTLGMNYVLSDRWDIEARFGPATTVDSDNDATSSSRLGALLLVRTKEPILSSPPVDPAAQSTTLATAWDIRPFVRYALGLRYTDFFESRDGTEHTFDAGLMFQAKFPDATLKIEAAPRRLESTLAGGDFTSFRLVPRLTVPLFKGVALSAAGDVERRWYDGVDPAIGRGRRDWRLQAFAGLDFAGAINQCLGRELFGEVTIGARLIEIDSNVASQDRSTLKFAASVALRIPLNYPASVLERSSACA